MLGGVSGRRGIPVPRESSVGLEKGRLGATDQVLGELSEDSSHHRQVLQVVVSLEQRVALQVG